MSPVIAPGSCLEFPGPGGETEAEPGRPLVEVLASWETRAAGVHRTEASEERGQSTD